jgi:outer membrane lipopolysaccharide assembly protein LptE/RlpB
LNPEPLNLESGGIVLSLQKMMGLMICLTVSVGGCGYRFSGQGEFPEGVERIFIGVFENRTTKTGIERIVTNQIVFEFTRQREKSIASSEAQADAVLKGVIKKIRTDTLSRIGTEVANEREVIMTVDVRLVRQGSRETLWAAKGITDRQAFDVADTQVDTDRNENIALARLSERMSERIFSRLTNNF